VAQLNGEKFLKRLSAAALETLAIVAYKQPVTKGEIEAIRGVSSDYAVQKLLEKELIVISGRNEKLPGHPLVYATSKNFMDYFGINSADDLPKIKEVLADQLVEPTVVHHTDLEQSEVLAVSDNGELIANAEAEPGTVTEENLNGHSFEMGERSDEATENDGEPEGQVTEDEPTEEAIEEYISDEVFIEGDEEEIEEAVEEEVADEEVPSEMDEEETSTENPDDEESSSEPDEDTSEEKEED
ncbi:MAG TPA: SMC-Scp complex subunit ScpB, partial [Flavisolibacter sp.]|nr:SMC-Scp complex subunit ScpB [Flavisolibacter sp.]